MCQFPEETRVAFLIEVLKGIDSNCSEYYEVFEEIKAALFTEHEHTDLKKQGGLGLVDETSTLR
ncbi:hypothetical protein [Bacillus altitudinis]|uniref:hypothetical protein n=1 Tax=Bacillus altitudinis TaxID=293387 RepID=UPI001B33231C|nr:hypothetical protein [Bacillus altitudinis]QTV11368.1 hypothetical protein J9319_13330 [Bacillus altitudinis]